jgi:CheY-like chemotaxis protein
MDAHTATHAFEPFFTTKEAGQGSGLGLSMVYGFAKQSQGHVKIYSEPGEGTAMKLYFPVANPGLTSHADDREDEKEERGSEHILVVEDDELVRKHLVSTLSFLGYQVSQAEHGEDALRLLTETADIDMLLTDVVLPGGMGGRETAEAARTLQPDIKVLYTSGYPQSAIMHNGRLDEGVELLSKPYRRREVARLVRKVLEG